MKKKRLMLLAMVCCSVLFSGSALSAGPCEEPALTGEGPVTGAQVPGARACVYKGIPYAAPPVGELRFKAPRPAEVRTRPLPALAFSPACAQGSGRRLAGLGPGSPKFSEDCLYLNIWRPLSPGPHPVMVFLHGGALVSGSGSEPGHLGDRLAERGEVVVVTVNYRLGAFGFLAFSEPTPEDPEAVSANFGILDQLQALAWVRDNISAFGGDPDRVTVFGHGAGGVSVCALLVSPLAQGLFQRAIIQSGSCNIAWEREKGLELGERFAARLACRGGEAACLRSKSTDDILAAMRKEEGDPARDWFVSAWRPVVDGRALPDRPLRLLMAGRFANVPLMIGSSRDEAKLLDRKYPGLRLSPKFLVYWFAQDRLGDDGTYALGRHYTISNYRRPADQALDAIGDLLVGCQGLEAANLVSQSQPQTFYYRFDYDDHLYPRMEGASHGLDLAFVFDALDRKPARGVIGFWQRKRARPLVELMMSYWTNFAQNGDPNQTGLPQWPAYNHDSRERMHLDLPPYAIHTDNLDKCRFWRESEAAFP